jgi:murein DD-endopeptidase MepM/ murein hydrolase activator NlpD
MRKAFLRAPLDFTRVSSNFNMRRMHPIAKVIRPHRGVDYAASTGTPVYASGDGKVTASCYSRSNGNYVFIQHDGRFMTRYLHLHKRTVQSGQRVKQGQTIGTVA